MTPTTLPKTCLPTWDVADLPEPKPLSWRNWRAIIGPGIVMMGIQIGGGEWLFGPEITARYGGGLMWVATIAIVLQVFYNMECGRYALYCGEPIFTGFMRTRPGPLFWVCIFMLMSLGVLIPGLSTQAAAVLASFILDKPPGEEHRALVMSLGLAMLVLVTIPVFFGRKVYNTMQAIMTAKVVIVLGFCAVIGIFFVSASNWWSITSGFFKFGSVPVTGADGKEKVVNAFHHYFSEGSWPLIALGNIAVLGAFAGYAGGGGFANSMYSNYVRDQGWGMGSQVGAIPSAVGGKDIKLSHLGKVFAISPETLRRWKLWWHYILTDQVFVWGLGCFVGMGLPALLSMQFAPYSPLYSQEHHFNWAQAVITADGMRHAPGLSPVLAQVLWYAMLFVGLVVLLPSQMSIVENFSRRWTDVIWSGNRRVREGMKEDQVKRLYYTLLICYVVWSLIAYVTFVWFQGTPRLMVLIIANMNNIAIGFSSFHLLWVNHRLLPKPLRPKWYHSLGVIGCGTFYLGLAALVFVHKQLPMIRDLFE